MCRERKTKEVTSFEPCGWPLSGRHASLYFQLGQTNLGSLLVCSVFLIPSQVRPSLGRATTVVSGVPPPLLRTQRRPRRPAPERWRRRISGATWHSTRYLAGRLCIQCTPGPTCAARRWRKVPRQPRPPRQTRLREHAECWGLEGLFASVGICAARCTHVRRRPEGEGSIPVQTSP